MVAYVLLPGDFGCEYVVVHAFFDLSFVIVWGTSGTPLKL
jgi:hypothetical protein